VTLQARSSAQHAHSTAAWRLHRRGRVAGYELKEAVLDSDGEAVVAAVLTGVRGRWQERRCSTQTVRRLRASCWATKPGEEGGVRRRLARRRTQQHGTAYRMEGTVALSWSCWNHGGVGRPVGDGRGERGGGDVHRCWGQGGVTRGDLRGRTGE
jgi:hypothetical protein